MTYAGEGPKKVRLSNEQLEKSLTRLYTHEMEVVKKRRELYLQAVEEKFTHNRSPIRARSAGEEPSEREKKYAEKLYYQPIERKKKTLEANEKKALLRDGAPTRTITKEDRDSLTERLYAQSIKQKTQSLDQLTKKFYGDSAHSPTKKVLDKEGLQTAVDSLYTKAVEKKKASDSELAAQYLWKISSKKITKDEATALAERLQKKS